MASSIAIRSHHRLVPSLVKQLRSRNPRRLLSTEASSKVSSGQQQQQQQQSLFSSDFPPPDQFPPPEAAAAAAGEALGKERKGLKYLSNGLIWAITGATAAVGYTSYAYTLDEVNEKTKAFRESALKPPPPPPLDSSSSAIDKYQAILYSAAIKVPARAIEMYLELRERVEEHVKGFTEPLSEKLLPDLHPAEQNVIYTLVLDLNETLLYTDWKRERGWRTFKRPGVDDFLEHLGKFYEIVVYSDQMDMYVYPVCEKLDPNGYIRYKLARGATKYENGKHYRDLSKLNRDPKRILYVSGNAFDTSLQPENCVPIKPYKLESDDTALVDLIPFLEYVARNGPADIRPVLASYERKDVAKEFLERSIEYQKRMQGQRQGRLWRR
ncbi:Mitochondrial import inner membrane translocase subunit TIM50 [Raphanus sativus]|uniref:Mitochondrial import inner membrane translocase subunit TIM50 n=1 Tax=Raphanus sativus TaxID=3726 RepID=A0A6J0KUA6_RAPSA|nr:mitochondrial import inner membrane translocase subunit TIM50 [Raphanus sativus]KAJ4881959.1 Mitochondrial import inner membrane translocase subunit TIM50 [Raphanus sativus]